MPIYMHEYIRTQVSYLITCEPASPKAICSKFDNLYNARPTVFVSCEPLANFFILDLDIGSAAIARTLSTMSTIGLTSSRSTCMRVCSVCVCIYYVCMFVCTRVCTRTLTWPDHKSSVMAVLGCNGLRCVINIILSLTGSVVYYVCICFCKADCVWVGRRRSRPKGKPSFEPFEICVFRVAQTWLNGIFPSPREFCGQLNRNQLSVCVGIVTQRQGGRLTRAIYTCIYIYMYVYIYMFVWIYTSYVCMCMYICVHACM